MAVKLIFSPADATKRYRGNGLNVNSGKTVEVSEDVARRLIRDFPDDWVILNESIPNAVVLGSTLTTIFTVPDDRQFRCDLIHVSNGDTIARTFRLFAVPPGGTALVGNALMFDVSIAAKSYLEISKGEVWREGTLINGLASVTNRIAVKIGGHFEPLFHF